MKEPIRLVNDPAAAMALREDLAVSRGARAPFDEDAGLARLLSAIAVGAAVGGAAGAAEAAQLAGQGGAASGAGAGTGIATSGVGGAGAAGAGIVTSGAAGAGTGVASGGAGAAASGGAMAKTLAFALGKGAYWGLAAAGVASITLAVSFATDDGHRLSSANAAPAVVAPVHPVIAMDPGESPLNAPAPEPTTEVAASVPARPAVAPVIAGDGAPARAAVSPGASAERQKLAAEVRDLAVLRAHLAEQPGEALAGTERARSAFAGGAFAEEREALAIEALVKLGRTDEARARAAAFVAMHPRSPLVGHVRALGGQ